MPRGHVELLARLSALQRAPAAVSRRWADETLRRAESRVRVRSGGTRRSLRIAATSEAGAQVVAGGGARYLEKGAQAHTIRAKGKTLRFTAGSRTVFSRKVDQPRVSSQPFLSVAARETLPQLGQEITRLWDGAA